MEICKTSCQHGHHHQDLLVEEEAECPVLPAQSSNTVLSISKFNDEGNQNLHTLAAES